MKINTSTIGGEWIRLTENVGGVPGFSLPFIEGSKHLVVRREGGSAIVMNNHGGESRIGFGAFERCDPPVDPSSLYDFWK